MPRKWGPCAFPRCPVLTSDTYCDTHKPAPWTGSTRRERLPPDWAALRKWVLRRDRNICYLCGSYAGRVDHIVFGDDHSPANLAAICLDCDRTKSAHEGGSTQRRFTL